MKNLRMYSPRIIRATACHLVKSVPRCNSVGVQNLKKRLWTSTRPAGRVCAVNHLKQQFGENNTTKLPFMNQIRGFSTKDDSQKGEEKVSGEKEQKTLSKKTFSEKLDSATVPLISVLLTVAVISWLASDSGNEKPDFGEGVEGFLKGCMHNIKYNTTQLLTFDTYEDTLLPDELPHPYSKPISLFIELDDLLATLKWDKAIGWRIYTRPGMRELLVTLGRYYEMVIYVNTPAYIGEPICQTLDPQFYFFTYRLYRDHMVYKNNRYVKDLSKTNRKLSKVIAIDVDADSLQMNKENGIIIKKWDGSEDDRTLIDMEKFLGELYILYSLRGENEDIRDILADVKAIDAQSITDAWTIYKEKLRNNHDLIIKESNSKKHGLFSINLIRNNARKKTNIVDLVESIARSEKAACMKESQTNLKSMIEHQKKHNEMIRKYLQESIEKRLKLWDYLFGDNNPPQYIDQISNPDVKLS